MNPRYPNSIFEHVFGDPISDKEPFYEAVVINGPTEILKKVDYATYEGLGVYLSIGTIVPVHEFATYDTTDPSSRQYAGIRVGPSMYYIRVSNELDDLLTKSTDTVGGVVVYGINDTYDLVNLINSSFNNLLTALIIMYRAVMLYLRRTNNE